MNKLLLQVQQHFILTCGFWHHCVTLVPFDCKKAAHWTQLLTPEIGGSAKLLLGHSI